MEVCGIIVFAKFRKTPRFTKLELIKKLMLKMNETRSLLRQSFHKTPNLVTPSLLRLSNRNECGFAAAAAV